MFNRSFLLMVGLALLLNAPGSVRAETPGKNVTPPATPAASQANKEQQAPKPAKNYTKEERQAYQKKMAKELDKLQQKFGDLKIRSREVPPQKKRLVLRTVGETERRNYLAKQKFALLEAATEKDWGNCKAEMDKAMTGLTQAVKALEASL